MVSQQINNLSMDDKIHALLCVEKGKSKIIVVYSLNIQHIVKSG